MPLSTRKIVNYLKNMNINNPRHFKILLNILYNMSDPNRPDKGPINGPNPRPTKSDRSRQDETPLNPQARLPLPLIEKIRDPLIGAILSERYRVGEQIGEGGMGKIYLAENVMIGRKVAIKVLSGEYEGKSELARRFIQESKLATRVEHE